MTLQPFPIEDFGGLRLDVDPEQVGFQGAIDALNVNPPRGGIVRSRDGFTRFGTTDYPALGRLFSYQTNAAKQLLVWNNSSLGVYDSAGTFVANTATSGVGIPSLVAYGGTSADAVYVADASDQLGKWTGSAFSNPASLAAYAPALVAVQPTDNRLIFGSTSSNASRVWFSDPGAPESIGANNWVDLMPGDGEYLTGIVTWRELVFVFKRSHIFIFYGTSTTATGTPVFNYRTVTIPGADWASQPTRPSVERFGQAAGADGVYFYTPRGIYRTTGGEPTRVSAPIDPVFTGTLPAWFTGPAISSSAPPSLWWAAGRLYVSASTASYVLDPETGAWSVWSSQGKPLDSPVVFNGQLTSGYWTGTTYRVGQYGATDDAGTAITSRYQSGFSDLGQPGSEKTIRETLVTGTGTPQLAWARDFQAPDSPQSVSLGSTRPKRGLDRYARVGDVLSYQLSATTPWQVNRLEPLVRESRMAMT